MAAFESSGPSTDYERTLCQLPSVHVFRIPPRMSADGHRASDWPKDPAWSGKLKIVAKGRQCAVILQDAKNQVFAVCPVSEGAVEKTLDSGRYFVLRIQNATGKHAYIGIAFNERNDAFDFNVTLQEHQKELEREELAASGASSIAASVGNLSLKEGEKIKINIGGVSGSRREKKTTGGSGGGFLPPPQERVPGSTSTSSSSTSSSSSSGASAHAFDVFGGGSSSSTSTTASSSSSHADPFSSAPFGSSDPFASSPAFGASSTSTSATTSSTSTDPFASDPFGSFVSSAPASSSSSTSKNDLLDLGF